jgi:hypothetical protein
MGVSKELHMNHTTNQQLLVRLFDLNEEMNTGTRTTRKIGADMVETEARIDSIYGEGTCERLSWYCTSGHYSTEDLQRWANDNWPDLNRFLEGDERSE